MKGHLVVLVALVWCSRTVLADGGFVPRPQHGVVEPGQNAVIYWANGEEQLTLAVRFSGSASEFAWLVPTPSTPRVESASVQLIYDLSLLTTLRNKQSTDGRAGGFGGGGSGRPEPIEVLDRKAIGPLETTILKAHDEKALMDWLDKNGYEVAPTVEAVLHDYILRGWTFTAMRVNTGGGSGPKPAPATAAQSAETRDGSIQPVRLTFRTNSPVYPLRISSINGGESQIVLYIITLRPVSTAGLKLGYRQSHTAVELARASSLIPRTEEPMWVTKVTKTMPASAMTRDLYFPTLAGY
jgi:hypothetical protein